MNCYPQNVLAGSPAAFVGHTHRHQPACLPLWHKYQPSTQMFHLPLDLSPISRPGVCLALRQMVPASLAGHLYQQGYGQ